MNWRILAKIRKDRRLPGRSNVLGHEVVAGWMMTSDPPPSQCYVYITLPGTTEFVTAGRFELATDRHGLALGKFIYGRSYLARTNSVPIDPIELKLVRGPFETTALAGVFGALRDAGPDYWGRRVIERNVAKPRLGEMDYLQAMADAINAEHDLSGNPVASHIEEFRWAGCRTGCCPCAEVDSLWQPEVCPPPTDSTGSGTRGRRLGHHSSDLPIRDL